MTPYLGFWYFRGVFLVFLGLFLNFWNNFWNLLKKLGRVYFLHFGHMSHRLGRRDRWTNGRTNGISTPRLRPTPLGWVKKNFHDRAADLRQMSFCHEWIRLIIFVLQYPKFICCHLLKKIKKACCPLPFFSITFFMFPPFTMAAIGHSITMQMCCEQGGGNIGEVE